VSLVVRALSALAIVIVVGGCELLPPTVALRTAAAPTDACMDALIGGRLVRHPGSGLGIASSDGQVTAVEWPFGYTAGSAAGRIALVDERGRVVAREGDEIQVGGGFGTQLWHACAPVSVVVPGAS
jgi:hypothetical protein